MNVYGDYLEQAFENYGIPVFMDHKRSILFNSFVEYINEGKKTISNIIDVHGEKSGIIVDVALQYNETYSENILSFVSQ